MKIEIRQLDWNPFRNIKEYPINKDKVSGLVKSIKQTSFWDNVLARPSPTETKRFEIAYGHHRLMALHKIYKPDSKHKIDIPVRELDDATMLKIMANENASAWTMDTAVVIETIKATEKFLVGTSADEKRRVGVLATEITEFLGGVFTQAMVDDALAMIHAAEKKEIDIKALKIIEEPTKAATFMRAIKELPQDKKPSPEKQREIASDIVKHDTPRHRIKETVEFASGIFGEHIIKAIPTIDEFVWQHRAEVDRVTKYINALADEKESIPNKREWQSFRAACALLLTALNRLFGDEQQKGDNNHGEKEERRAVQQGPARALLDK